MKYRKMNATGLKVSELCLGTMTFGAQTSEKESLEIIDYALSQGVNFIDTADAYNKGESERIVGKALKGCREDIILASKVCFKTGDDINARGLNRRHIIKQIEESIKSLQTDYLDIYYLHAMDGEVDFEETLDTMTTLVRSGKVRYIGISNYPAWQLSEMLWTADKRNLIPPIVTQNMYNIITREVEHELVPCLLKHHIGMTVYNPIAGGFLTGKYLDTDAPMENTRFDLKKNYMDRYWRTENFEAVRRLSEVANQHNMSLLSLSLNWCLAHSYVDSIICGVSKLSQLEQNIEALHGEGLSEELKQLCDDIGKDLMKHRISYFK
ncbi:aldo/keto reductase [Lachnoclostridium phytofermentans]|uniref:Aldo/keto reductase n=1 Tax=Lachnoclostridium phytofermentans (strain ATCC 700394 / DSM 18823 / ISDg) TaxID=357809 RepID=A9KMI4_LACP7|nr:aldo/keto reductase [Lachnoclostridium phytofermentans]ABX41429.1 aldo/keto reductase [Lachnoclostridium phytofermentans ISDg]